MTAPVVYLVSTDNARGCTGCGTQATVTLDPRFGRRCADCPPWLALAGLGEIAEAFDCLSVFLAGERIRRFARLRVRLLSPPRCWCGRPIGPMSADGYFCTEHDDGPVPS